MRKAKLLFSLSAIFFTAIGLRAGEADIHIPSLAPVNFSGLDDMGGRAVLFFGLAVCAVGTLFGCAAR